MAVRRMVQAGAVPITWMAGLGEWQRDWAREKTATALSSVIFELGGASAVAFAWEMQLLASVSPMSGRPKSKPIDYDGLMQANLARVFGEHDADKRLKGTSGNLLRQASFSLGRKMGKGEG